MIDIRALLISFCCGLHTCLTSLAFPTYLPTYLLACVTLQTTIDAIWQCHICPFSTIPSSSTTTIINVLTFSLTCLPIVVVQAVVEVA